MSKAFVNPSNYFPEINQKGIDDLYKLVEIVYNCHFSYASDYREDLYSVGLLKAIDFIKSGSYDPSRSSLKNVLYTGMRNEMKNYLHKLSKDSPVEDTIIEGANEALTYRVDDRVYFNRINLPRCRDLDKVYSTLQFYGFDLGVEPKFCPEVIRWVNIAMFQMIKGN